MTKEFIIQQLKKKYIEPTKKKRSNYIGVEIEIPIVNLNKKAVDFSVIHQITRKFIKDFDFKVSGIDDNGDIFSAENPQNGDILSFDCSYNNLEFSFGKEKELFTIQKRFKKYYSFFQNEFKPYDYTLTGMGVNPYRKYNQNVPIENGRYRMLFHHLHTYKNYNLPMYFHNYPDFGTFSSASQVQLDVDYDKLPLTITAFSKLEPLKALLFNNSLLFDEHKELHCCRDMFWENSTHGINPHNIGMFDCDINSEEDLLNYIASTSIYCVEREDKYINFPPVNIIDYFNRESVMGEYYDRGEYKNIEFKPCIEDLQYLRTFKFVDLTFRGTIEFRSACCQPLCDSMTVAAFHMGLINEVKKLNEIFENDHILYHNGYNATELRKMFVQSKLPDFVNEDKLYALAKQILDLSKKGLLKRGFGEEEFLIPLYKRIENKTNPAKKFLTLRNNGVSLEDIIIEYSKI